MSAKLEHQRTQPRRKLIPVFNIVGPCLRQAWLLSATTNQGRPFLVDSRDFNRLTAASSWPATSDFDVLHSRQRSSALGVYFLQ